MASYRSCCPWNVLIWGYLIITSIKFIIKTFDLIQKVKWQMTLKNGYRKWPLENRKKLFLQFFHIKVSRIHIFCHIDTWTDYWRLKMTSNKPEVANYLPFYIQKYIETIYFWNQCERSYHMRQDVTFILPEVAYYFPYITQKDN